MNTKVLENLIDLSLAYWKSQALYVATKLRIADLLASGPKDVDELARETKSHVPSLYRLLRALASFGIFSQREDGRFELTQPANFLLSGSPTGNPAFVIWLGEEWNWKLWNKYEECVRTGKSAYELLYNTTVYEWYAQNPDESKIFDDAMMSASVSSYPAIAENYDFSSARVIVDVGGEVGGFLCCVLRDHSPSRGILFELPHVIRRAKSYIKEQKMEDRCKLVAGDFLKSALPDGGDLYVLKYILHAFDNDRAVQILMNCRQSMASGARVLIIERLIGRANEPNFAKLRDLNLLSDAPGGLDRTDEEYVNLLGASGFKFTRNVLVKQLGLNLLEGVVV